MNVKKKLVQIGALCALRSIPGVTVHVQSAIKAGVTKEEIMQGANIVFYQAAVCYGYEFAEGIRKGFEVVGETGKLE